jgi:hypothetical protein
VVSIFFKKSWFIATIAVLCGTILSGMEKKNTFSVSKQMEINAPAIICSYSPFSLPGRGRTVCDMLREKDKQVTSNGMLILRDACLMGAGLGVGVLLKKDGFSLKTKKIMLTAGTAGFGTAVAINYDISVKKSSAKNRKITCEQKTATEIAQKLPTSMYYPLSLQCSSVSDRTAPCNKTLILFQSPKTTHKIEPFIRIKNA